MKNIIHFGFKNTQKKFLYLEGLEGGCDPIPENKDSSENQEYDFQESRERDNRLNQTNQKLDNLIKTLRRQKKTPNEIFKMMGCDSNEKFSALKENARDTEQGLNHLEKKVQMLENVIHGFPPSFETFSQETSATLDNELEISLLQEEIKSLESKNNPKNRRDIREKEAKLRKLQEKCEGQITEVIVTEEDPSYVNRETEAGFATLDGSFIKYPKLPNQKVLYVYFRGEGGHERNTVCTVINNKVYTLDNDGDNAGMIESDQFRVENGKIVPNESFDPELHKIRDILLSQIQKLGGNSFVDVLTVEGLKLIPYDYHLEDEDFKKGLSFNSLIGGITLLPNSKISLRTLSVHSTNDREISIDELKQLIRERSK